MRRLMLTCATMCALIFLVDIGIGWAQSLSVPVISRCGCADRYRDLGKRKGNFLSGGSWSFP